MRILPLVACVAMAAGSHLAAAETVLETPAQQAAYSYGRSLIGAHIVDFSKQMDIDPALVLQGIQDELSGAAKPEGELMDEMAMRQFFESKQQEVEAAAKGENMTKGQDYLAATKAKEGVQATESGLLYEVMVEGEGAKPVATDTVQVHYQGTLIDGTEFDSSFKRGQPISFALNRVIPGWTEGLQLMSVGSKYRFHIPSELAYGENAPPNIGPNQVLVFEVQLLDIIPAGE